MVDINKYKKNRFNKDSFIDKLIKALFLYYDIKVEELKLTYQQSLALINHMIRVLVESEEYELAAAFKRRKFNKWKKCRKVKRLWSVNLFYRVWRFRFYKLFKIRKD